MEHMSSKINDKFHRRTYTNAQIEATKYITCFYVDELGFYRHLDPDQLHSVSSSLGPTNRQLTTSSDYSSTNSNESCYKEVDNELGIMSHYDRVEGFAKWKDDWDKFMTTKLAKRKPVTINHEFKMRIRSGIPHDYRPKVWTSIIRMRTASMRLKFGCHLYSRITHSIENDLEPNLSGKLSNCFKQIELDVLRTLPNNCHFENTNSKGIGRVRRVLKAYACFNPKVGYCQGMNRLAAISLLVLPEEEAFWCLVGIIHCIMPQDYYLKPWLAQVDCTVLSELMKEKMPKLYTHLTNNDTQLTIFTWFFTIFVDSFRPELMLRIWDCFLLEGDIVLFRFSLAVLWICQDDLLKLDDLSKISAYLSKIVSTRDIDVEHIFDVAFNHIDSLSKVKIDSIREDIKSRMSSMHSET